ncbi:MAG: c-type cytochrome [Deltaproteobacteria bacterium]|nr:c-type cytochrome [Deltaproteobacteria bacterium]
MPGFMRAAVLTCGVLGAAAATVMLVGRAEHSSAQVAPAEDRKPSGSGAANDKPRSLARGESVFRDRGCVACHGADGRGGIPNPNYLKETTPRLDLMAERLMLFEEEDAKKAIDLILSGADLSDLSRDPPFVKHVAFSAQLQAVQEVIRNGSPAGKKDPRGPEPLAMPKWGEILSEDEIRSVIAYLVSRYPWERP